MIFKKVQFLGEFFFSKIEVMYQVPGPWPEPRWNQTRTPYRNLNKDPNMVSNGSEPPGNQRPNTEL